MTRDEALARARTSLDGLSVGDALGERFFGEAVTLIMGRRVPAAPWRWTDDTQMAMSVVDVLAAHGRIEQDALARALAGRYEPGRGYGAGAARFCERIVRGEPWQRVAASLFEGRGSYGNGAATRAAPIGAWFAGDLARAAEEGRRAAEVTHAHPEGQAGGVAVAVAAALAALPAGRRPKGADFLRAVAEHTPPGEVRDGLLGATRLDPEDPEGAAELLGSGQHVSAQDTVPFALFCAAHALDDYARAIWNTLEGLGDRDTTCAIVGGVVALAAPVPPEWLLAREPLR